MREINSIRKKRQTKQSLPYLESKEENQKQEEVNLQLGGTILMVKMYPCLVSLNFLLILFL